MLCSHLHLTLSTDCLLLLLFVRVLACNPCGVACREVGVGWKAAATIDLRGKKKDTCKVPAEVLDQLRRVHVLGAVPAKSKKKAGKKKK